MTERRFDDFNRHATGYRDVHTANVKLTGANSYYFAAYKIKLLQEYEQNNRCRLLDLGCGDGTTEVFINKYFPAFITEAIDVSEKSIEEAAKKRIPQTSFTVYDGQTIPFEDNYFDIVFVAAVLHHIDFAYHEVVLLEIFRVLKPGGRLYLFEHNPINPATRYLVRTCVFDKDARLLRPGYSKKLLQKMAFQAIKMRFILFFPRKGWLSKLIPYEPGLHWLPLGGQYLLIAKK